MVVLVSCDRVKPEPPAPTQSVEQLDLPLSTLVIPVQYHIDSLEATINQKIQGTFLRHWITVNDKGDSLYLEASRSGRIQIAWRRQTLYYAFPVHVSGKFIKRVAGLRVKNAEPVSTEMILHMATKISIAPDWNLKPSSQLQRIEWIKDPTLKIALLRINLRKKVEQAVTDRQDDLVRTLDVVLQEKLATRTVIAKLWDDIQKPIRVNKKEMQVWLKPEARDLRAKLTQDGKLITLSVELNAYIRTVLEGDPMPPSNTKLPPFRPRLSAYDSMHLFVLATIPFDRANELLNRELKDFKIESQGYTTTIKALELYGTDDGLAVMVRLKGDVSGNVYLQGLPAYDTAQHLFTVKDFRFTVDSENALLNSADWLLHDDAVSYISSKLRADPSPLIAQLPMVIEQAIERGKSGQKIDVAVNRLAVRPGKILVTRNNIQVILEARGAATIGLQKSVFAAKRVKKRPTKLKN